VVGSSVGYFVRPPGTDRAEGSYPEVVADLLADDGIPAAVRNSCTWLGQVHQAFRQVEQQVVETMPDVLVVNFGWMECQPRVIPTAVLRVLTTHSAPLNRWRRARVQVSWQLSRVFRRLTRELAAHWRGTPSRMDPPRFERELSRLVDLARKELRALVLVLNVNPPTDRIEHFLPTVNERTALFSDIIGAITASRDDAVRLIDTRSMVQELGADKVLPDGIHFNVEGHHRVAEMITREILDWLG